MQETAAAARAFRALADPTRRTILRELRSGPLTSGEIASRFDSSWPTISRHLAILRDAGLVTAHRLGQEVRYELDTTIFQDLAQHVLEWTHPGGGASRRTKAGRTHPQEA
jgi:DNA-binding transcriptional ArsR family regulator